jgi:outer membrane lipoprotein-sorting protein
MRRPWRACLAGVTLLGVIGEAPVLADGVPLPRPAPFAKSDVLTAAPPVASSQATQAAANPGRSPATAMAGSGGTMAFDSKQRSLVEKVNTYLTGVQTLVGDFVQVAPDGGRSRGKFYLQKPGRIRFNYDPPSRVELIADGQSLVVRDRKLATQDVYPLSQTPLQFLLADRIDLLHTDLIGVYADNLFVTLVIEQKQIFGGAHRLLLMFGAKDFRLRQWTITDEQGYGTTVAVYNLDASKKLDPELFKIN